MPNSSPIIQAPTYVGPDRRTSPTILTEEQIDHIAQKAAEKAVQMVTDQAYKAVGKSVVSKLLWIIGVLVVGSYAWAKAKGFLE